MFGVALLVLTGAISAFLLWADRNGRRVHKD
jgi:hypothetical protein